MSALTTTTTTTTEAEDDGKSSLPIAALSLPSPVNLTPMPKQRPVCITLDSLRIFILSICLISLVHFSDALVVEAILVLVPFLLVVHNDYENFISLGPGGTPSTVWGYLRISWLRLWTLRDPFTPPKPTPNCLPLKGILSKQALPFRLGPKPRVVGIAPQRQIDQPGSRYCYQALRRTLEKLSLKKPAKFGTERSCIEKHGLALFARHPVQTACQGEICHVHDSDHSMHMCLHPDDSKEVLSRGWGQRHPLAWKWWFLTMPVATDFVMIYAPRDDDELRTVCKIVEAAIWYSIAEETEIDVYLNQVGN